MGRLIINGNKVYELDENCMRQMEKQRKENNTKRENIDRTKKKGRQFLNKIGKRQVSLPFSVSKMQDQKIPQPEFPPLQQKSSRMMIQQLFIPHPFPPSQKFNPLLFPQQHKSSRIQIMFEQPFEELPHEQLVAAKSLIFLPPCFGLQFILCVRLVTVSQKIPTDFCKTKKCVVNSCETKLDTSEQIAIQQLLLQNRNAIRRY